MDNDTKRAGNHTLRLIEATADDLNRIMELERSGFAVAAKLNVQ